MSIYYTVKSINEAIDRYMNSNGAHLLNDEDITPEQATRFIKELRIFRKYADEFIEELIEDDRRYDEEMAEWKAKQEKEKAEQEEGETQDGADS